MQSVMASTPPLLSGFHSVLAEVPVTRPKLTSTAGNLDSLSPKMMLQCSVVQHRTRQGRLDRPRPLMVAEVGEPASQALLSTTS